MKDYIKELGKEMHKSGVAEVGKSYIDGDREYYPFVLSSTALDSDNEVVDITSAKLERFISNPVGFFQHESGDLPILTWHNIRLEGNKLLADAYFHELPDEEGFLLSKTIKDYVKAGVLKAVSIGFRYSQMPESMTIDGQTIWVIKEPEIYEASIVTIPSNPEALIIQSQIKAFIKTKAGAVLSKNNIEKITQIRDIAQSMLDSTEPNPIGDDGKSWDDAEGDTVTELKQMVINLTKDMAILLQLIQEKKTSEQSQTAKETDLNNILTLEEYLKWMKQKSK